MATALGSISAALKADTGLKASVSSSDMAAGLAAAEELNALLMRMISQTGANSDRLITAQDMAVVAVETYAYPADYVDFLEAHGNDNGTVETGFHHLQDDGGTLQFRGRDFVDTVIDAIYHFGFNVTDGRYVNEDGASNETEPRRICRRLQLLSRMEHHEQDHEQVFP